jgi:hypothetical protein
MNSYEAKPILARKMSSLIVHEYSRAIEPDRTGLIYCLDHEVIMVVIVRGIRS